MSQEDKDLQKIEELLKVMKANDLVEVELKHGEDKILLKRFQPQPIITPAMSSIPLAAQPLTAFSNAPVSGSAAQTASNAGLVEITSPIVGTYYATPSPDSDPYVEIGSRVETNTVACIVEAMKVMNEIKADTTGTIAQVLVKSGQAVEYGQVLFRVKPD